MELDLILGIYLYMKLLLAWILKFVLRTLPMFHAFTGYDIVSAFCGRGKKTAWNTWKVYPEVIKAFEEFPMMRIETSDMAMEILE